MGEESFFPEWKSFLGKSGAEEASSFIKSVVKRSGDVVPYDRAKIEGAIGKAICAVEISRLAFARITAASSISVTRFSSIEVEIGRFSNARAMPFSSFFESKGCLLPLRLTTMSGFSSIRS